MTLIAVCIAAFAAFLAFANGANDNSKGVATLIGSGLVKPKPAILYAAAATALGSIAAIWIGAELAAKFKGKGIVDAVILGSSLYPLCVGIGAGVTVMIATRIGMPISTTHAMVGAIIGTGMAGGGLHWQAVWSSFFYPLLASPFIAVVAAAGIYWLASRTRRRLGITAETCVCIGDAVQPVTVAADGTACFRESEISLSIDERQQCVRNYQGRLIGLDAQTIVDRLHLASSGAISFARGLNDTPKIAALTLGLALFSDASAVLMTGVAMALGGLLMVRRVSETMSRKITDMNDGQAFSANLTTAFLVIIASRWGIPVSTTHVSCGSLFGIGLSTGRGHPAVILKILSAWIFTLPCAAAIGALIWLVLA